MIMERKNQLGPEFEARFVTSSGSIYFLSKRSQKVFVLYSYFCQCNDMPFRKIQ